MTVFQLKPALVVILFMAALTTGCGPTYRPAPVEDRTDRSRTSAAKREAPPAPKPVSSNDAAARNTAPSTSTKTQKPADAKPAASSTQTSAPQSTPRTTPAQPPVERDWRPDYYTVRKGDTLYSIALDFGQDYRDVAAWNNLANAAYIQVGQRLRVSAPQGAEASSSTGTLALPPATLPPSNDVADETTDVPTFTDPMGYRSVYSQQAFNDLQRRLTGEVETTVIVTNENPVKPETAAARAPATPVTAQTPAKPAATVQTMPDGRMHWEWPAPGELLHGFSKGRKGIAIQGQPGQPVVSSAPGKVVYSGSGLRGYGNLIIVKHNATYLSVYAHNRQLLVSEGQMVAQGQKIGVMGEISPGQTALHFEIRQLGKPIDPLRLLPERSS